MSRYVPLSVIALVMTAAALPTSAQRTKIVTPPGSTTRVTTTPGGDQIITVTVNSKPVQFEESRRPMMLSGRVMVPLRGVFERLGGEVLWEPKGRVVTGSRAESKDQFRLRVGSTQALVNGENVTLDTPPRIAYGTTYVPLRFVSEALGAKVTWDNANRAVVITAPDTGESATVNP